MDMPSRRFPGLQPAHRPINVPRLSFSNAVFRMSPLGRDANRTRQKTNCATRAGPFQKHLSHSCADRAGIAGLMHRQHK